MNENDFAQPPYTGGCDCGEIRYHIVGEPLVSLHCQCRQCQRSSGTGHASYLTFLDAEVQISGTPRTWELIGERGNRKARGFCAECGTPTFLFVPEKPNMIAVTAASLDNPERFAPQMLVWTKGGLPWDHADPSLQRFEKLPPGV